LYSGMTEVFTHSTRRLAYHRTPCSTTKMFNMKRVLIVEDESLIAFDLERIVTTAGYYACGIADNVTDALRLIEKEKPDIVLIDIILKGPRTGIDLGRGLTEVNQPFIYLSANFQES